MGKTNKNGHTEDMAQGKGGEETLPAREASETVYAGGDETVYAAFSEKTVYAGDPEETVFAGEERRTAIAKAEKNVALDWNAGDVILGLYEVLPVDDTGRAYHAGGFGKVYKVRHKTWKADLAVKAPQAHAFAGEAQKKNFIRECEAWISLGVHPNIASCYYVRELGGVPRIFAEYVTGGSLKDWIRGGRLYEGGAENSLRRILDISIQFAWGLNHAHERDMIHGDVKPQNVMMTPDGEVKVVDFGLSRAKMEKGMREGGAQETVMTAAGGFTPAYCSPEQMSGRSLTRRMDLWSFGVSLMEMFAGEATWQSGVIAPYVLESLFEQGAKPKIVMPDGVRQLLKKCFAKDEAERPRIMLDAAKTLIAIYEEVCGEAYPRKRQESASSSADTLNNRALSHLDLGDQKKAEQFWDKAIEIDPHNVASIYNKGLLLWRSGRITDAELVSQLKSAGESNGHSWTGEYLLGMVHAERGDAGQAARCIAVAMERFGDAAVLVPAQERARAINDLWDEIRACMDGAGLGAVQAYAPGSEITVRAYSADGRLALLGGHKRHEGNARPGWATYSQEPVLILFDIVDNKVRQVFSGHKDQVISVALSEDGCFALSGSSDNSIRLWDISTGECLQEFTSASPAHKVAFCKDGEHILTSARDTLKLWDIWTGEWIRNLESTGYVFDYTDRYVAGSKFGDTILSMKEIASGQLVRQLTGHKNKIKAVCFSPDGSQLLSGSSCNTVHQNNSLKLWDVSTGACIRTLSERLWDVDAAAFCADPRFALSWNEKKETLRLWDTSTGKCLRSFESVAEDATLFAPRVCSKVRPMLSPWHICRPESSADAAARENRLAEHMAQGEELYGQNRFCEAASALRLARALPAGQKNKKLADAWALLYKKLPKCGFISGFEAQTIKQGSACADITSGGQYFLLGDAQLWSAEGGCVHAFEKSDEYATIPVLYVFSPDGRQVVTSNERTVRLWDIASKSCLRSFKKQKQNVTALAFSPDGRYVLSGLSRRPFFEGEVTAELLDIASGECLRVFECLKNRIGAVAFSTDGRYVLAGDGEGVIAIWDVATGQLAQKLKGHTSSITSIALSGDGRYVLSGSHDNSMMLWDLAGAKCLRTFTGHQESVSSVVFCSSGRYAFSGSYDRTIRLWDVSTGACLRTLDGGDDTWIFSIAISADDRYLIAGGDGISRLWELSWDIEDRKPADWDEGAAPYLQNFLKLHQPISDKSPTAKEGVPEWTEQDFEKLIADLGCRGYGWLSPEGVRAKLTELKKCFERES